MTNQTDMILLVDDDQALCELLCEYLRGEGFNVDFVNNGQAAIERMKQSDPLHTKDIQALVLDIMMPGMSGLEVLQVLRKYNNVPVIMLTGRGDDIDRILGLELGADDYLAKPCNPRELAARLRAILRRSNHLEASGLMPSSIEFRGLSLRCKTLQAYYAGKDLQFTQAEFRALLLLVEHFGQSLSKDLLTEKVLNRKLAKYDRSIDVHISRVRQKLALCPGLKANIKSIRGIGYQLITEEK